MRDHDHDVRRARPRHARPRRLRTSTSTLALLMALTVSFGVAGAGAAPTLAAPGTAWVTLVGGEGSDYLRGLAVLPDGGSVVVGDTGVASGREVLVARLDVDGTVLWTRTSEAVAPDSNFAEGATLSLVGADALHVGGFVPVPTVFGAGEPGEATVAPSDTGNANGTAFVARYDLDGSLGWATAVGGAGTGVTYVTGIASTSTEGSVVVGYLGEDGGDTLLALGLDANGAERWRLTADGAIFAEAVAVGPGDVAVIVGAFSSDATIDPDGEDLELTRDPASVPSASDLFVLWVDGDGTPLRVRTSTGSAGEVPRDVVVDGDGAVTLIGEVGSDDASFGGGDLTVTEFVEPPDVVVVRYDADGTPTWLLSGVGSNNDGAGAIALAPDGGFVITGYHQESITLRSADRTGPSVELDGSVDGGPDAYIARYADDGTLLWATRILGTGDDVGWAVGVTSDDGVLVAGFTERSATHGLTDDAPSTIASGGSDGFVTRFGLPRTPRRPGPVPAAVPSGDSPSAPAPGTPAVVLAAALAVALTVGASAARSGERAACGRRTDHRPDHRPDRRGTPA
jgi:hypothetical protein